MGLNRRILLAGAGAGALAAPLLGKGTAAHAAPGKNKKVTTGAQAQADAGWAALKNTKLGIITNPTGVLDDLTSIVDNMHAAGLNIVGVFGPEHGFRGTAQAGEAEETYVDERTGITVYDAYGANTDKMVKMFTDSGVETVVFDIQDVGARFYTYIWTMYTAMKAAAQLNKKFVVLDRPNPTGGTAYGPMMTEAYTSGVGAEAITQQHGMSVGELARFLNGEIIASDTGGRRVNDLKVIEMSGWDPASRYDATGLDWVMPSPNMPTPDTAVLYPGTGMFEGTNLSEGRGTTRPFEVIGAPYVDHKWNERLTKLNLPGVKFREMYFTPTFNKYVGEVCGGVQVHVVDPAAVNPIRVATEMLVALKALYPKFAWRQDSWDTARPFWIDKLTGSTRFRELIDAGKSANEVEVAHRRELREFDVRRQRYLLYKGKR